MMPDKQRPAGFSLSCIIPAFNEAARIGPVLATAAVHPLIGEVIVVDDGSTDDTAARAAAVPGVTLVRLARNVGKTRAVAEGVVHAKGAFVLLLDADLTGLTADALTALIAPVRDGQADAAISLRGNAPRAWHLIGLDYISGERVVPARLLTATMKDWAAPPGFGLEVRMNSFLIAGGLRLAVVPWPGVHSPAKARKMGLLRGIRSDLRMMGDIFRTVPPLAALRQIVVMRWLRTISAQPSAGPQPFRAHP